MLDQPEFEQILNQIKRQTPRQFEVLEKLLQGLSDVEIASDLHVAPATVRKHIERLCHRFQLGHGCSRQSKRTALLALFAHHRSSSFDPRPPLPSSCRENDPQKTEPALCRHNLPTLEHTQLIGREQEVSWLLERLQPGHADHRLSIEGPGGVGKTSLVLEVVRRYLTQIQAQSPPPYAAILFTSAQPQRLTLTGILPKLRQDRTRKDILRTICHCFECVHELVSLPEEEQGIFVQGLLQRTPALLIVDNLESLEDREQVLSFLYDLPAPTKVILTSRETGQMEATTLRLGALDPQASRQLIHHQAQKKQVEITPQGCEAILSRTGGLPAAIVYTLGQLAAGYEVEDVLEELIPNTDLAQYCFGQSMAPLQNTPAHQILLTLGLFPRSASREALQQITQPTFSPPQIAQGLAQLQHLSLCYRRERRYYLMPLTQEYVLAELSAYPRLEAQIRQQWLAWLSDYVITYSTREWREWQECGELELEWDTLRAALDWCMAQGRGDVFYQLWDHLKGYTHAYGYWQERLQWMTWLQDFARQQGDWAKVAESLTYLGRTLALINHPEQWQQALAACQQAWELRQYQSRSFQFDLIISITLLLIRLEHFPQAQAWLDEGEHWLKQEQEQQQQQVQIQRWSIYLTYYRARLYLCTQQYVQARQLYQAAISQAEQIQWKRALTYSRAWLAVVALQQNQWDEAAALLQYSLQQAQHHQDRRCIALCQSTYAQLEILRGDPVQANHWRTLACQAFKQLNMTREIEELELAFSETL